MLAAKVKVTLVNSIFTSSPAGLKSKSINPTKTFLSKPNYDPYLKDQ